ncbi:MAG: 4Fe-4S dicluster domain-containing protein [Armatimonadetes bacterium]|nr:4Fe-4S dicluster domain-containing protein [Armatimonadota bacterium]MDW8122333.1 4Fe-4S dicluster domain-containing protein [Armatimonadota bacterium]
MRKKRTPIVDLPPLPRGRVRIIEERCKGCAFCIEFCPQSVLVASRRFNSKGYHPPEIAKPEACVCCNLCWLVCPEFAIFSVPLTGRGFQRAREMEETGRLLVSSKEVS